jgi:DNA-binding NarL/FixJ family response regulator
MKIENIKTISVLIVDDHKIVRDGIRNMLNSKSDSRNFDISLAQNGEEALELIFQKDYDIIFMDHQMPGLSGSDTIRRALIKKPDLKFLTISNYDEPILITEMLRAGSNGYVLKNIDTDELILAIDTILLGKKYFANDVANKMITVEMASTTIDSEGKKESISKREMEILIMIANEYTNEQIAEKLNIAKRTVDSHRQNLLNKLNVRNTAGLIHYAYRNKLI